MKKSLITIAKCIFLLSVMLCLITCDNTPPHCHDYSTDWTYDEINHWHHATCNEAEDCLTSVSDIMVHTIVNGMCDICGYSLNEAPETPEEPTEPETPTTPENPETPDAPDTPETPEAPKEPETPEIPEKPAEPENSETPENPECTHQYTENILTAPGCVEQGEKQFICTNCGDSYTESVPPTGHTEQTTVGYPPTCEEAGLSAGISCLTCTEVIVEQFEIYPSGHSYVNGVCSCGATATVETPPVENEIKATTTANYCWVDKISFTAPETGEYTLHLPAGLGAWDAEDRANGKPGPVVDSLHPEYGGSESSFAVSLMAGTTYEFYVAAATIQDWIITWTFVECEVLPEEPDEPETPVDPEIDITGTYYGTDAYGNQRLTVVIDSVAGTVVFNYEHHLTGPITVYATYEIVDGSIALFNENGSSLHPLSGTLTLVGTSPAYASYNGTEYSLSTTPPDSSSGGNLDADKIVLKGLMKDGQENTFTVTAEDIASDLFYVAFTPINSGEYDFVSKNIFVISAFTTDGKEIKTNNAGNFVLESSVRYILHVSSEYVATIGEYTITPRYIYPAGTIQNPLWIITGNDPNNVSFNNQSALWYQFYPDATGTLTINCVNEVEGLEFKFCPFIGYEEVSAKGSITVEVVQGRKYYLIISVPEAMTEKLTIMAKVEEKEITYDGSVSLPYEAKNGENSTTVAPKSGVYYIYKSTGIGEVSFSLNIEGVKWCFVDFVNDRELITDNLSVHLDNSHTRYIYIENTTDETIEVSFTASFKPDPKEIWLGGPFVLDGSSANSLEIKEDTYLHFRFIGVTGSFTLTWDNLDAIVEVNDVTVENGDSVEITSEWFGVYLTVYMPSYGAGSVKLTVTPTSKN